jgi:hypothetical protein
MQQSLRINYLTKNIVFDPPKNIASRLGAARCNWYLKEVRELPNKFWCVMWWGTFRRGSGPLGVTGIKAQKKGETRRPRPVSKYV